MSGRCIYVDIDDVLSLTIESLIDLLERLHDRRVEVGDVRHFDLARSFDLEPQQLGPFMDHAHSDEVIEAIHPAAGAASVLDRWGEAGDRVSLITGRPPLTNAASLRWLETHGIRHESLHHLDKWNRPDWNSDRLPALRFEEIGEFGFDFAVEDSLETAVRLVEDFAVSVALMDRPWNRGVSHLAPATRAALVRCFDWGDVERAFA